MNGIIKVIAAISMIIDHTGSIIFNELTILRIIGRLSLPLFAYCIAQGYKHTSDLKKYISRLVITAIISQIPYSVLHGNRLNILFAFAASLILLYLAEKYTKWVYVLLLPLMLLNIEYRTYGIILVILFKEFEENSKLQILGITITSIIYSVITGSYLQMFSLTSLFIISKLKDKKIRINKYIFYGLYPVQWLVFTGIKAAM